ncbi:hypothetical protein P0Y35_12345 [Kiritimatiellaeota bacterium B1221]|nr:hypothetical protein [Kiritimatiellaeota bacterium B1221]
MWKFLLTKLKGLKEFKMKKTKILWGWMLLLGLSKWSMFADAPPNECINNLRLLESAIDQAAIEDNMRTGAIVPKAVIAGYLRGGLASVRCPANGFYTFGTVDDDPFCSIHGTRDGVMKKGRGVTTKEIYGREPVSDEERALDDILTKMTQEQGEFDPAVLNSKGAEGIRQLANRLFPQSSNVGSGSLSKKEFDQLITEMGTGNFKQREEAERRLTAHVGLYRRELELAARGADPELKRRAKSILKVWDAENKDDAPVDYAQYLEAMKVYVAEIENASVLQELQVRAKEAKVVGATSGAQEKLMNLCLEAQGE